MSLSHTLGGWPHVTHQIAVCHTGLSYSCSLVSLNSVSPCDHISLNLTMSAQLDLHSRVLCSSRARHYPVWPMRCLMVNIRTLRVCGRRWSLRGLENGSRSQINKGPESQDSKPRDVLESKQAVVRVRKVRFSPHFTGSS